MSIETYECLVGKLELRSLLEKGFADIKAGRTTPAGKAIGAIRKDLKNGTL